MDNQDVNILIEWLAVLTGLVQVLLAYKRNVLNFLFAIISSLLFIYIFVSGHTRLYAEAILQTYYVIMGVYGWIKWGTARNNGLQLPIQKMRASILMITLVISIGGWLVLGGFLEYFTDSTVPYWDALVAAVAFAGTWLLARKILENWWVLNVSNAIAIPLYIHKELYLTAALTGGLFVVAIFGYFSWKKIYANQ